jgi:hypothetical protein
MLNEQLLTKWQPVIDHEDLPKIGDHYRRVVTAHMLEQQENALREESHITGNSLLGESTDPTTATANVDKFNPVLISLVRRTAPNLIAFDVMGVQPMTGPSGLVFALRPTYAKGVNSADETANAFYAEANTSFSAGGGEGSPNTSPHDGSTDYSQSFFHGTPGSDDATRPAGAATGDAESWGSGTAASSTAQIPEMSFSIDKSTVTAVTRALKAEYSVELAQDLKAIHGLDAETELANILTTEVNAEINREIVRTIYFSAKNAASANAATNGDLDGRWLVERFKALVYRIETEANAIAKDSRRGKGNFILCTADVASALATAGVMDPTAALTVDDTGSTFAGTIGAGLKVYIDPYSITGDDFVCVGYKGTSPYDAGLFYCPYVPLQMVRAIGEDNFQPKIGFKTRYGMAVNPFAQGVTHSQSILANSNRYYRGFTVRGLNGTIQAEVA